MVEGVRGPENAEFRAGATDTMCREGGLGVLEEPIFARILTISTVKMLRANG